MRVIYAFLLRDLQIERSYRFNILTKSIVIFFQLAAFYFISKFLIKPEYFSYVFIGLMFSKFFQFWLNVFSDNISQEQYWGTAEPLFLSPVSPFFVMLGSISGKLLVLIFELFAYILFGVVVFRAQFLFAWPQMILLGLINAFAFAGLGLISGSFIMYFKRGDLANWVMSSSLDLLSGVYFPLAILPESIRLFAKILPTTSALSLWRDALSTNLYPSFGRILVQMSWAVTLVLLGFMCFNKAFNNTRKKGELGNY